ncbi:ABC transporter permease [Synoicihabitans lomoniglobus]|uniref:ABC transporter permease n=1 Tax=Synoicihabitans lomoniglobus TaxID=2909285 RepID=A0AAF0CSK6_9BACT|nr:ABC transporter permease [Opitutaceae bacterium LMO-M01]WED67263.1 ABC transporter permease [Opitutaceae bacterium LMO-M01]
MLIALRSLLKSPGFTAVAVLTIAIGIGANTVLFSVFNAVVLNPLDFPAADRLVRAWIDDPSGDFSAPAASWPKYEHYRDNLTSVEALSAATFHNATLTGEGDAEQLSGLAVTSNFLSVHGKHVARGRDFTAEDDVLGGENIAILSHELWQNRFGGRAGILGQTIQLNGVGTTVVGVLPPAFPFPYNQIQYLLPRPDEQSGIPLAQVQQGGAIYLQLTGRLKTGVSLATADAELHTLSAAYNDTHPARMDANSDHLLRPYADELVGNTRPTFYVLLAACGFVLLIACANIASLFLGRLSARQKEIAVRLSLGATRRDIIRQFLTESLLFSLTAGLLGVLFSLWAISLVSTFAAQQLPRASEISFSGAAMVFSLAVAGLTSLLVGFVPAWQASRAELTEALKDTARTGGGGNGGRRFRAGLIVTEVALSVTLLVGAGLLMTSFWKLLTTDAGFRSEGVAAAFVNLPTHRYDTMEKRVAFYDAVNTELTRQPAITHASQIIGLPLSGFTPISPYTVGGTEVLPLPQRPLTGFRVAGQDYKELVGLTLIEGRWFEETDTLGAPTVVVINASFARRLFGGDSALGHTILTGANGENVNEIVGVIADVKTTGLNQSAPDEVYYCASQRSNHGMGIAARTTLDPISLQGAMRTAVASVDPTIAISFFQTLDEITLNSLGVQRIAAWLIGCFSAIAFLLAIVGLYSVLAYNVTQRTAEIGIRMALGAMPGQVIRMILSQGLRMVALGVGAGLLVSGLATQLIASQLFGVESLNVVINAVVALSFVLVATFACLFPARRAAQVDPMIALRSE